MGQTWEHSSHEVTQTAGGRRGGVASALPMNPEQHNHLILNGSHKAHGPPVSCWTCTSQNVCCPSPAASLY